MQFLELEFQLNAKGKYGETAISRAAIQGKLEIIEILASVVNDPNAPDKDWQTPIFHAERFGHTEIIKFLAPLTKNPRGISTPITSGRMKRVKTE